MVLILLTEYSYVFILQLVHCKRNVDKLVWDFCASGFNYILATRVVFGTISSKSGNLKCIQAKTRDISNHIFFKIQSDLSISMYNQ